MPEIITNIKREKGFTYYVNKEGNIIKTKYNLLKDPYTLVTLAIIILGGLYYLQISQMNTIESNFESTCLKYIELRNLWIRSHPGHIPTLEEVFSIKKDEYGSNININQIK